MNSREKEELIRQMKSEFADAIKQKDAIIEVCKMGSE